MRLDETCSPRTEPAPPCTLVSPAALAHGLLLVHGTSQVQQQRFPESRKHRVKTALLSVSSVCSESHMLRKQREREVSHVLASNSSRFSLEERECQKHFASHEKKIPAQKLTTFLRRYSLAVNHRSHPRGSPEDSQPSWEGGKEKRGGKRAQKCTHQGVCLPLPWSLSNKEGPDDLCECW